MRDHPALKLARSPLIYVLAQIRFPAQLKLDTKIADIQEALKKVGFVGFAKEESQQVSFGPQIKMESGVRWVFTTRDRRHGVVLAQDFLVLETSDYDVFETFLGRLTTVIEIVREVASIDHAEHFGLRYVDLIRPANGFDARDFLSEGLRGLSSELLGAKECVSLTVIQAKTDYGILFVRTMENREGQVLPPDLVSSSSHLELKVEHNATLGGVNQFVRILDIDHVSRKQADFKPNEIVQILSNLHSQTSLAFRAAVTAEAIEFWQKER